MGKKPKKNKKQQPTTKKTQQKTPKPHSKDEEQTIKMEPKRYQVKHYRNYYSSYEGYVLQMA